MPLFLFIFWSLVSWILWFKADGLSNKLVISEVMENNIESFKLVPQIPISQIKQVNYNNHFKGALPGFLLCTVAGGAIERNNQFELFGAKIQIRK